MLPLYHLKHGRIVLFLTAAIAVMVFSGNSPTSAQLLGSVSGTVREAGTFDPLGDLQIHIYAPDYSAEQWGCTAFDGTYTVTDLPVDTTLIARFTGNDCFGQPVPYFRQYFSYSSNQDGAAQFQIPSPINLRTEVDFELEPGGIISGTVYDESGTNPLPNIMVTWTDQDNIGTFDSGVTCSDLNGLYSFNVPYGVPVEVHTDVHNTMCSGPDNTVIEYWQEATVIYNATLLTLNTSNPFSNNIDFTVAQGGIASGTVYDTSGSTPLENISVWYEGAAFVSCTDSNGDWILFGVPVGVPLKFTAGSGPCPGDSGYQSEWYFETNYANATPVSVVDEFTPLTGIDFTLAASGGVGTISGTVYEETGTTALAGIGLTAWNRNNFSSWNVSTCTNGSGNYSFNNVPADVPIVIFASGSFGCPASSYGGEYWQETPTFNLATSITLSAGNMNIGSINFTLPPTGTVYATVYDETGTTPLVGVPVTVQAQSNLYSYCTNASGQVTIVNIPYGQTLYAFAGGNAAGGPGCSGGSYEVEWWQEASTFAGRTTFTLNGGSPTANLTFTLEAAGTITGTITNASTGNPVVSGSVSANTGTAYINVNANSSGVYTIKGVPFDVPIKLFAGGGFSNPSLAYEWWNNRTNDAAADTVTLTSGSPTASGIDFSLPQGASISGVVYDETGTTPLGSVPIRIDALPFLFCTNGNGQYNINGLTVGENYTVYAGGNSGCLNQSYNVEWWQESATEGGSLPITLVSGGVGSINFTLSQGSVPAPGAPTLTAPSGVSYDVNPVFTWTGDTNATHYRLYVQDASTGTVVIDEAFTSGSVCTGTNCAVEPAVFLNTGTNYSAWVQAINTSGSAWSNQLDFTVAIEPPSAPTLTAPAANITDTTPTYGWNEVGGATSYRLFVTDNVGTTVTDETYTDLGSLCSGGACTATPADVLGNETYSAWLQAINAGGGTWSSIHYFTISTVLPPAAATVTAPSGSTSDTTPLYEWNEVSGATHYRVYVTDAFGTVVVDQVYNNVCAVGLCGVDAGVTLNNGSHTVWVQTSNGAGSGPWSNGLSFMVSSGTAPAATTVTAPSGTTTDTTPTYTWNEVSGATNYRLYVTNAIGAVVIDQVFASGNCTAGTCTADPAVTLSIGSYTTWVLTSNGVGNGPWSAPLGFYVVESAPAAPTLIAPTGAGAGTQPTYQWNESAGATQYRLYVQDAFGTLITNEVVTNSVCSGGVCSHTPSSTLTIGTGYTWWVLAANSGGGNWSASANFVVGSTPGTATITAPASPTTNTQPTYEWTEVSGATNYRLYVNTVGGTVVIDQVFPSSNCTAGVCSVTPAVTLTASEAYQVWVLASNAIGNGAWAGPYNFSVIP